MSIASICTVFNFTLQQKPGTLLALANRLREADITLQTFWATGTDNEHATMRCIAERESQFRDFARSAELSINDEKAIYISTTDSGGDLIRMLEKIAGVNINIESIQALTLSGKTGWVIWAQPEQMELLLERLNS